MPRLEGHYGTGRRRGQGEDSPTRSAGTLPSLVTSQTRTLPVAPSQISSRSPPAAFPASAPRDRAVLVARSTSRGNAGNLRARRSRAARCSGDTTGSACETERRMDPLRSRCAAPDAPQVDSGVRTAATRPRVGLPTTRTGGWRAARACLHPARPSRASRTRRDRSTGPAESTAAAPSARDRG